VSVTQTLRVVSNEPKAEKGLVFETADHLATAYICFADLSKIVDSDSISDLAHKVVACTKELVPDPDRPITSGGIVVSEYAKYLGSLHAFAQLPAVLNDFREHGRQVFAIEASLAAPEQFQPFGLSLGNFTWSAQGNQITIIRPLGANRYQSRSDRRQPLTTSQRCVAGPAPSAHAESSTYLCRMHIPGWTYSSMSA